MKTASPKELYEAAILHYAQKDEDGEYGFFQANLSWRGLAHIFFEIGQPNGWEYLAVNDWLRYKKLIAQGECKKNLVRCPVCKKIYQPNDNPDLDLG